MHEPIVTHAEDDGNVKKQPAKQAVFLRFFYGGGVQTLPEDHKPLEKELRDEVQHHNGDLRCIFVPAQAVGRLCKHGGQISGHRGEHRVKAGYLRHGDGDIVGGLEGEFSVQSKVPQHGQDQRDEVGDPVADVQQLVHERHASQLDDPCAYGQQQELHCAEQFLLCVGLFHESLLISSSDRF